MSGITISSLLALLLVSAILKPFVYANFACVCSSNGTKFVYTQPNADADIIGVLRRDVCKAVLTWNEASTRWATIAYLHQTGHVKMDDKQHKRECYGDPQAKDVVPVTQAATTTIPTTPTTSITTTTTTPTTTTPTTTTTIPTTTTTTTIPQGNVSLCPDHIIKDASRTHGLLTQYGNYCYELVPRKTYWSSADTHCHFLRKGRLMYITNVGEQNFITEFLTSHHYVEKVWIGLTDIDHEGNYTWSSGAHLTYKNFANEFNMHTHPAYDCIVMQQGGQWIDTECESTRTHKHAPKYASICQYHVNTTLGSIVDLIHGIVG